MTKQPKNNKHGTDNGNQSANTSHGQNTPLNRETSFGLEALRETYNLRRPADKDFVNAALYGQLKS